jgi:hypothetical protein
LQPKPDWKTRLLEHREGAAKGPMWKRVLRIGGGVIFLVLGIIGFFVPILQGFLFTLIGLTLLSRESRRVRRLLYWLRGRTEIEEPAKAESGKVADDEALPNPARDVQPGQGPIA